MEWLWTGFWIGFIGHLRAVTTNNYNIIADLYTLQIATAHTKSFPACIVVTKRFLVTAYNNGYFSVCMLKSSLDGGSLPAEIFLLQTPVQN
jgi:hypothetical protein